MANRFATINGSLDAETSAFVPSRMSTLHLGDRLFLERLCDELNRCLSMQITERSATLVNVYVGLEKHGFLDNESPSISLDWSSSICLSPVIEILIACNGAGLNIDPFASIRRSSQACFNDEIASSKLRLLGKRSKLYQTMSMLERFDFRFSFIGKADRSADFQNTISGLEECKSFIDTTRPDLLLTYDNYWMHYALSVGIPAVVVQRRKFRATNLINHVCHLNRVCGEKIYYV